MINCFEGKYAFLSNYYPSVFTYEGIEYPTNEHFFQAMKTLNIDERKEIAACETPGRAKRMGRRVQLRPDWEEVKVDVMREGLRLKFQNPKLRAMLLATGDEELIEGNTWHDRTWGRCICSKCGGQGQNLLGQLLMELREEIHYEEAQK